jgi:hypothetical protein
MHRSLTRRFNGLLIGSSGAATAILLVVYRPDAIAPAIAGAAAGVLAGSLQACALWIAPGVFAQANSAADVRRQLMSSLAGKLSIFFVWLGAATIGWIVWNLSRGYLLGTFAAGYLALMFVRELITMPVLRRITRARESAG